MVVETDNPTKSVREDSDPELGHSRKPRVLSSLTISILYVYFSTVIVNGDGKVHIDKKKET